VSIAFRHATLNGTLHLFLALSKITKIQSSSRRLLTSALRIEPARFEVATKNPTLYPTYHSDSTRRDRHHRTGIPENSRRYRHHETIPTVRIHLI